MFIDMIFGLFPLLLQSLVHLLISSDLVYNFGTATFVSIHLQFIKQCFSNFVQTVLFLFPVSMLHCNRLFGFVVRVPG